MLRSPLVCPLRPALVPALNSPWPVSAAPPPAPGGVTWDAAHKSADVALSSGNLLMTVFNGAGGVRSTESKATGKWYFEFQVFDGWDGGNDNFGDIFIGVATAAYGLMDDPNDDGDSVSTFWGTNNGLTTSENLDLPNDGWGAVAVDLDAQKLWFRDSNGWRGDPEAGTGPSRGTGSSYGDTDLGNAAVFILGYAYANGAPGSTILLNVGASAFQYTPPSGFTAWGS